ncbi:mitotic checkpoint serine/threonine-protein kinase BUB1 isoform X2 [Platichthys flesus]|uniref:mitotic checkpoint serine/threonine-protein kinase BUB1 isoform X2 n=1 Tax=Platichthys flesus TaxID=8260 RepID=UPI002DB6A5FA|nr:mitotic checkpoint serine/threonine-protein kinase BUB1 isoform X2 [Platichthys flesus]
MDFSAYLQSFESRLSSYTGDDPLDPWDKFVEYLEQRLPADGDRGISVVFDSLVQRFLNMEQYANDIRYVNYCIKCASYYSDPIALYSHVFSKGVGTRTAALYLAWAQQFEQRGLNEQADAVYQKAVENQAQPADTVLHEYRQFQTRSQTPGPVNPLQTSHLTNQMTSHREPVAQSKASVDWAAKPPEVKTVVTLSRSENSGVTRQGSGAQTVSEYMTDELTCEGSELSFEEVRAEKYFRYIRETKEKERRENMEKMLREEEEGIRRIKSMLDQVVQNLETCGGVSGQSPSQKPSVVEAAACPNPHPTQNPFGLPRPSNHLSSRRSLGLSLHAESMFNQEAPAAAAMPAPPLWLNHAHPADTDTLSSDPSHHPSLFAERSIHCSALQPVSYEQRNLSLHRHAPFSAVDADILSHDASVLPDLWQSGRPQEHNATHLDVSQLQDAEDKLNDVIMDMFQAPTLLEDQFNGTSGLHMAERGFSGGYSRNGGDSSFRNPPSAAPFTIFQDDKENASAAAPAAVEKPKPIRALAVIAVSKTEKPNDTPPDLMPDESTMWGARYNSLNSLDACPNSTRDFDMQAQCVSTPFTHKNMFSGNFFEDQENNCDGSEGGDDPFVRRQPKKLSPIIEQSPSDDKLSESNMSRLVPSSARQGTIVGEGLASSHHCLTTSSITMVQPPPPTALSFRDQTLCPTDSSLPGTSGPGWEVYSSPEQPPKPESSVGPTSEPFQIFKEDGDNPSSPERVETPAHEVPMSPACPLKLDWMSIRSPEVRVEPDLDAFLSPLRPRTEDTVPNKTLDVPMSPEQPQLCADVPMSPEQQSLRFSTLDEPMSPDRGMTAGADVSMNTAGTAAAPLVSDPWDNELISGLLSTLAPPLTSHPRCVTWPCNIPNISPKMTISMGKASLRVDCVLGEGAFATVYQATDPMTSERMILKVQRPANPWEFYIHTQLDARLPPGVRRLYSSMSSAHLFHNGSVLLGELHNHGTLLNTVNMYKALSDKVMPQPLVMYFTVCILHMVETLHRVHVIHADIKPDNFLLGERFLENKCFDSESLDHGLVLIDLGQSIDMELFPEGTAFTAKCLTSGFQCTEMLGGKPWNYQTDFFGIAGTVFCLLFGTYMQVTKEDGVWRTNAVFRRNPHSALWLQFFHTLLNVPGGGALPSLRRLRGELASVLQQNYSSKLSSLKSRLVVQLLESRKAARR